MRACVRVALRASCPRTCAHGSHLCAQQGGKAAPVSATPAASARFQNPQSVKQAKQVPLRCWFAGWRLRHSHECTLQVFKELKRLFAAREQMDETAIRQLLLESRGGGVSGGRGRRSVALRRAELIEEKYLNLEEETNKGGQSLLHVAVRCAQWCTLGRCADRRPRFRYGKLGAVRALLEHGANPNVANVKGYTPLHLAVRWSVAQSGSCALIDRSTDVRSWRWAP
jgi:hypothetical protein